MKKSILSVFGGMSKIISMLICLVLICLSCDNPVSVGTNRQYHHWKSKKKAFSSYMTHFPNYIESGSMGIGETMNKEYDYLGFKMSNYGLSSEVTDTLQKYYDKNSLVKYGVEDSTFIACDFYPKGYEPNFEGKTNWRLREKFIAKFDNTGLLPMPRFDSFYSKIHNTRTKYPKGNQIYILGASPEPILPDSLLPKKSIMPLGWQRGYSRGIVLNKEKRSVIYWLIYW